MLTCWRRPLEASSKAAIRFRYVLQRRRQSCNPFSINFAALACWRRPLEGASETATWRRERSGGKEDQAKISARAPASGRGLARRRAHALGEPDALARRPRRSIGGPGRLRLFGLRARLKLFEENCSHPIIPGSGAGATEFGEVRFRWFLQRRQAGATAGSRGAIARPRLLPSVRRRRPLQVRSKARASGHDSAPSAASGSPFAKPKNFATLTFSFLGGDLRSSFRGGSARDGEPPPPPGFFGLLFFGEPRLPGDHVTSRRSRVLCDLWPQDRLASAVSWPWGRSHAHRIGRLPWGGIDVRNFAAASAEYPRRSHVGAATAPF